MALWHAVERFTSFFTRTRSGVVWAETVVRAGASGSAVPVPASYVLVVCAGAEYDGRYCERQTRRAARSLRHPLSSCWMPRISIQKDKREKPAKTSARKVCAKIEDSPFGRRALFPLIEQSPPFGVQCVHADDYPDKHSSGISPKVGRRAAPGKVDLVGANRGRRGTCHSKHRSRLTVGLRGDVSWK
jgi:hypothetical protein